MYVNELIDMLRDSGCRGCQIAPNSVNIQVLLYADDLVICSDTPSDLQHQLIFRQLTSCNKYLGLTFSSSLKWNKALNTLVNQSCRSLGYIFKLDNMCGGLPPNMAFNLYDKLVVPVLCYGSEIWGYEWHENIERAHNKFCKWILGVSYNASKYLSYFTEKSFRSIIMKLRCSNHQLAI